MDFNGTIEVKHNPRTMWETYSHTFEKSADERNSGYRELDFSKRAEGGYYRASFSIRESTEFLADFVHNALGREVKILGNAGQQAWEGFIYELEYDAGRVVYKVDLGDMANAVWVRYRIRGTSTTSRSTTQTDEDSIARYGRKEFILSGGELESSAVADAITTQYLSLHSWPRPSPARIDPEKDLSEYPVVNVKCRGWIDTLNWMVYNQTTDTDAQGSSAEVAAVLGTIGSTDATVGYFIESVDVRTNSTSISKEYDADRRGGDIIQDIARVGDSAGNRWLAYMDDSREFVFEEAAPPDDPT